MPRFVILRHDAPRGVHFDFMLESGGVLKTWSLPQPPRPGVEILCEALPDHRLAYLDYEGPVSGDRGTVTRWDHGTCTIERQTDVEWTVQLNGERTTGLATLRPMPDQPGQWRFLVAAAAW
jgi:hypothetical protein